MLNPTTLPPRHNPEEVTQLYRHFNKDGVLLYVGISLSAVHRLSQHANGSGWFNDIALVKVETFKTRSKALKAETAAIQTENPLYNVACKVTGYPASKPKFRDTAKKTRGLTVLELKYLQPAEQPYEVRDEAITGGRVVVWPSGKLSYIVRYRIDGVSKKLTIGVFDPDDGGLIKVRAMARSARGDLYEAREGSGLDPNAIKRQRRRQQQRRAVPE